MLSRTVQLIRQDLVFYDEDEESELTYIQYLKNKLETIVALMLKQKQHLQNKYIDEIALLREIAQEKNQLIERLEIKIHQLEKQNQQIRFQYEQRVSLMAILKRQNWLISKQFSEEREKMRQNLDYLLRENQNLKQNLIRRSEQYDQYYYETPRHYQSPKKVYYNKQFNSMKELDRINQSIDKKKRGRINNFKYQDEVTEYNQNSLLRESAIEQSVSRSSIQDIFRRETELSRITEIKSANKRKFNILEKMSTKTHLSRHRMSAEIQNH